MKRLLTILGLILTVNSWAASVEANTHYNISINNKNYLTVRGDLANLAFDTLIQSFKGNAANQVWLTESSIAKTKLSCTIGSRTYYLLASSPQAGSKLSLTTLNSAASLWDLSSQALKLLNANGQYSGFQVNNLNGEPRLGAATQLWTYTAPFQAIYPDSNYTFSVGNFILTADTINDSPAKISTSLLTDNSQIMVITGGTYDAVLGKIMNAKIVANVLVSSKATNIYMGAKETDKAIQCFQNQVDANSYSWEIYDDGYGNIQLHGIHDNTEIGWLDLYNNNQPLTQREESTTRPTQKWKFTKAVRTTGAWER